MVVASWPWWVVGEEPVAGFTMDGVFSPRDNRGERTY